MNPTQVTVHEDWNSVRADLMDARRTAAGLQGVALRCCSRVDIAMEGLEALETLSGKMLEAVAQARVYLKAVNGIYDDYQNQVEDLDSGLCRIEVWFQAVERARPPQGPLLPESLSEGRTSQKP